MSDQEIRSKHKNLPGLNVSFPEENFLDFYTSDGIKLQTYRFACKSPRCVVINFHGLHNYTNTHAVIGKYLSESGFDFVGYDQRGHGKSEGVRGLIPSFRSLYSDCCRFVEKISILYENVPIYVTGSSMGGALCFALSSDYPDIIKGIIALNPALSSQIRCQSLVEAIMRCVTKFSPSFKLKKQNRREMYESDEMFRYTEENRCIYTGKLRVGTANTLCELMKHVRGIRDVAGDVLVILGMQDEIIDPDTTIDFVAKLKSSSKEIIRFQDVMHSIISSYRIEEISQIMVQWLMKVTFLLA